MHRLCVSRTLAPSLILPTAHTPRTLTRGARSFATQNASTAPSSSSSSTSSTSSSSSSSSNPSASNQTLLVVIGSVSVLAALSAYYLYPSYTHMSSLKKAQDAHNTLFNSPDHTDNNVILTDKAVNGNLPASLPADAPQWMIDLAQDPLYQYKDITVVFPVNNHLIYDALKQEQGVTEFFHFIKKDFNPNQLQQTIPSTTSSDNTAAAATVSPTLRVIFYVGNKLCGHSGIIHGGLTATLIDQVSGECAFVSVGPGVFTANLNINYTKPLIAEQYISVDSSVVKQEGRKTVVDVRVTDGHGAEFANAKVLFVRPKWVPEGTHELRIKATAVQQAQEEDQQRKQEPPEQQKQQKQKMG